MLLQQQMHQQTQNQPNFQQPRMQQPYQQLQNQPSDQNQQTRHVLPQSSPQGMASPQSQMQFHKTHVQGQLPHQSVISVGPSSSTGTVVTAANNFLSKMPPANVSASNYNNTTSVDYVNNAINTYTASVPTPRAIPSTGTRLANNVPQNYQENVVNSVNSSYQHNFIPSTSQNTGHDGPQSYSNADGASTSGNYAYPAIVQNSSMGVLSSLPTPAPTPSPTPTQSPTRYMQRASVITSDSTTQQNGMYSIPNVDKFLMGDDINLNDVGDLNQSLLQSNIVEQFPNSQPMVRLPIIDPATNQPIQISEQLHTQIESQLQLDAASQSHLNNSQINSQEIFPADMLESTIGSSINVAENLLQNDISSSVRLISGDLSMTPPLSSSVPQLDSVPSVQGMSEILFFSLIVCLGGRNVVFLFA